MRKTNRFTLIYVFLICSITISAKTPIPELYKELNETLSKREFYIDRKQETIDNYKVELKNATTLEEQYRLSAILAEEYTYFNVDSALFYSGKSIDLASELKDEDAYRRALIKQAYILSWQGYFHEPIEILRSIDAETLTPNLRSNYYDAYMMAYNLRQQGVMSADHRLLYRAEALKYTDMYLASQPVSADKSPSYLSILAFKYYQLRDYKTAVEYLTEALHKENNQTDGKIRTLYMMYLSYAAMGEEFKQNAESYLLQSAILGVKTAKLRGMSLITMALLQNEKGNYSLAFNYIDAAIANMELCQNTDFLKNAESVRLIIQNDYNKQENKEQRILYYCAILAIIMSVVMLGVFIYILNKNKQLRVAQEDFLINNKELRISNSLKDSYIIHWLNISSSYIDKLDETKKLAIRRISAKQSTDSLKLDIDAIVDVKEERQKLCSDFDKTFYKIHSDFIERVNSLLQKEYHFLKDDIEIENSRASTELRILALIKMGASDNKQIASYLQFTIQSVYNYRSKVKARALNPDTFDDDFEKI